MAPKHVTSRGKIWKASAEERAEIVRLYRLGHGTPTISSRYGVSNTPIIRILREHGIGLRSWSEAGSSRERKLSDNDYRQIAKLYSDGLNAYQVADKYNIHSTHVLKIVQKLGGKSRSISEANRWVVSNENAFETLTPESAAWVGFLMADGNVGKDGKRISLFLQAGDVGHIEKFRDFIGARQKIHFGQHKLEGYDKIHKRAGIVFHSEKVADDLRKYGIVPVKSLIAEFKGGAETNIHAWRGLIDGDGSVGWRFANGGIKYPYIALGSGSQAIMKQFREFALSVYPASKVKIFSPKNKTMWTIAFSGRPALALIKVLYGNGGVSLDRKQKIADEIMAEWQPIYGEDGTRQFNPMKMPFRRRKSKGRRSHYVKSDRQTELL